MVDGGRKADGGRLREGGESSTVHRVIHETRDVAALAACFRRDPVLYAYCLGDLDPFFFPKTRWWVAGDFEAALLLYSAFETPVVQGFDDGLWDIDLPPRAHVHCRRRHLEVLARRYRIEPLGTHLKMEFRGPAPDAEASPLGPEDLPAIRALHEAAYPGAYLDARTLDLGMARGVFEDGALVAFAGCHVYSREYGVAAIGAVATHPAFRGRGLAGRVTGALVGALGVPTVTLNVHAGNAAAIRVYERLGFVARHEYEEATIES